MEHKQGRGWRRHIPGTGMWGGKGGRGTAPAYLIQIVEEALEERGEG